MNSSTETSLSEAPDDSDSGKIVACVILGLSFLIGTPGNLLVIWTILRYVKQRLHTLALILHLAVADTLILITLPVWIYSLIYTWKFGVTVCNILVYIIIVCMYSSIFLITLISVERFLAICHPFLMMRWKPRLNINICLSIVWLLALVLGVPEFISDTSDNVDEADQCFHKDVSSETQTIIFLCLQTLLGFVLPLIILTVCYCLVAAQVKKMNFNSKQKSRVLIHTVVIVFILCWLPYHIVNIIDLRCILFSVSDECVPQNVVFGTGALIFISSSVNPLLYAFFARNFQKGLEESRLVKLFQEVATNTNKLWELAMKQQTDQSAASIETEMMSSSLC